MKFNYQLANEDFLAYQLFASTKSKLQTRNRKRAWLIIPILYVIFAILLFLTNKYTMGIGFLIFAGVWLGCYPLYSKWRYKRYFQKYITENYKSRINKNVEFFIGETSITIKDIASEGKINGAELEELIETQHHFFLKLTTGVTLIIPKHAINSIDELKKNITQMGAEYIDELQWEWK